MSWGHWFGRLGTAFVLLTVASCASDGDSGGAGVETVGEVSHALSTHEAACNGDPRVWEGLVTFDECVGARLFFDEKFKGNGRKRGSCHPASNNFTIDRTFMQSMVKLLLA